MEGRTRGRFQALKEIISCRTRRGIIYSIFIDKNKREKNNYLGKEKLEGYDKITGCEIRKNNDGYNFVLFIK